MCFCNPPNYDMDYKIFKCAYMTLLMHAYAHVLCLPFLFRKAEWQPFFGEGEGGGWAFGPLMWNPRTNTLCPPPKKKKKEKKKRIE